MRSAAVIFAVMLLAAAFPAVSEATFPGKPGRIVFTANAKGDSVLFDYDLRMRRARQLTHRAPGCERSKGWTDDGGEYSPSGRLIAYVHYDYCASVGGNMSDYSLWVMRADGRGARMLSPLDGLEQVDSGSIAFSPDGRRIAVMAERGPVQLLLDARTGRLINRYRWPRGRLYVPRVDWGVGGRLVIDGTRALWRVTPRGGAFSPITFPQERGRWSEFDGDPSLSPSGRSVAFVRGETRDAWRQEYAGPTRYGVWRTSTRKPHRAEQIAALGETEVQSPVFSPDGRRLAFVTYEGGRIRVMPSRGGGPIRTLRGLPRVRAGGSLTIDWQPRRSGGPR